MLSNIIFILCCCSCWNASDLPWCCLPRPQQRGPAGWHRWVLGPSHSAATWGVGPLHPYWASQVCTFTSMSVCLITRYVFYCISHRLCWCTTTFVKFWVQFQNDNLTDLELTPLPGLTPRVLLLVSRYPLCSLLWKTSLDWTASWQLLFRSKENNLVELNYEVIGGKMFPKSLLKKTVINSLHLKK